jgi:hypothetical protein
MGMPAYQAINFGELQSSVAQTAADNARRSLALEQELDPNVAALRQSAFRDLLAPVGGMNTMIAQEQLRGMVGQGPTTIQGAPVQYSPLLAEVERQAMAELQAGGKLPAELANRTTSQALMRSGVSGAGGRDLVARDLGLSAMGLQQQRRGVAERLGQGQQAFNLGQQSVANAVNQFNAGATQQNRAFQAGLAGQLSGMDQSTRAQQLSTAGLVAGINRPESGMDPGALASARIAENNAMNQYNQQKAAAQAAKKGAILKTVGTIAGTVFGGPVGGMIGGALGGAIGGGG